MDGRITAGMAERYRTQREGNLLEQVAATIFPTPTARDWKGCGDPSKPGFRRNAERRMLAESVAVQEYDRSDGDWKTGLRLNGKWVSRLMGFPDRWLDVDDPAPADQMDARWSGDPLEAFNADWEDGVPRVAIGETDRTAKLRALGNAVVPQVPFLIMSAIAQQMREEDSNG